MSKQNMQYATLPGAVKKAMAIALGAVFMLAAPLQAAEPAKKKPATVKQLTPPTQVQTGGPIEFASQINATVGKSTLLRLPAPATRISVGSPDIADVILLNPSEIYLLGKKVGATNIILWSKSGQSTVVDVAVGMDTASLQGKLQQLLPNDKNIRIMAAADTVVLSGTVTDAIKADRAVALAEAFAGKKVVNMLGVSSVQQVMLEVKIAEINRTLLEKLGLDFAWANGRYVLSGILGGDAATFIRYGGNTTVTGPLTALGIDAQKNDGLIKILAEPSIVAISGQEGSFLAGGEILIPVPQGGTTGGITMESKEFGVGLRFTPTVLEDGIIQMRVSPEVTDLVGFTNVVTNASAQSSVIVPTLTTRRVSTAVELRDGQSLAIGGLLQNNVKHAIDRFPVLGEIPVLGALFRSNEYKTDKTELLIVVTPRLVKPLDANYALPTDSFVEPNRFQRMLKGTHEGAKEQPATSPAKSDSPNPQTSAPSGFEMK